jgi:IS30 family transposase
LLGKSLFEKFFEFSGDSFCLSPHLEKDRVKTITADNGGEFHGYSSIEQALETSVYFAQPRHA